MQCKYMAKPSIRSDETEKTRWTGTFSRAMTARYSLSAKTKRLTWESKAKLADLVALEQDIQETCWGSHAGLPNDHSTIAPVVTLNCPFSPKRRVYPIIVTLEEWYFFGHELPVRLENTVRTLFVRDNLPINWLDEMPYSTMSVDEFETAAGVINTTNADAFISGKIKDPQRRHWGYSAYCGDCYAEAVAKLPVLFDDEFNALFADIVAQQ